MGVKYDPGGGGSIPLTSFADALTAATTFYTGPGWMWSILPESNVGTGVSLDTDLNTSGAGMSWGGAGAFGTLFAEGWPSAIDNASFIAKSATAGAFAQFRFVSKSAAIGGGLSLYLMSSVTTTGYQLQISTTDGGTCKLGRFNGSTASNVFLDAALFAYAATDLIRLEARNVGATVELKSFKNGILQKTTVDNSVSRLTSGLAGMILLGSLAGNSVVIKDFACGTL